MYFKISKTANDKKTPILKSFEKGLEVLSCFKHDSSSYTLNELATMLDMSKGTIHRILVTAEKNGFVEQDPETRRYRLGLKMFELGSVVERRMDLRAESLPVLKKLSEITGQTSYILIKSGYEAIGIERVEGHNYLRMLFLEVGKRMPLHLGGGPKVLLAYMTDEEIEDFIENAPMKAWTDNTIVERKKLWDEIQAIRKTGISLSMEDVTIGAAAVGAPIRNASGEVIAAVSIAGAKVYYEEDEQLQIFIEATGDAAEEISKRLGYIMKK